MAFAAAFHCGCFGNSSNENVSTAPASANIGVAKTNAEELSLYVKIPFETEDIVWREFPDARKITAVLRFSTADAARLATECSTFGPAQPVSLPVETWFPEELVAQGEMSGDSALRGNSCPANSFFLEPYMSGRVIRIESTDYFVLEVFAR